MKLSPWNIVAALAAVALVGASARAETIAVERLSHIHGLAVDAADPSRIYVATHHGLYVAGRDGMATLVSVERHDFMGFTPHPNDPRTFFGSGHPERGGNLGFIVSSDGGRVWRQVSPGLGGPVDFHQMAVAASDPQTIYGVYGGLQRSRDGGRSWVKVGPPPDRLIALAVDRRNAENLYAAAEGGLFDSLDGGKTWRAAHMVRRPATMAVATRDGSVYAYMVGTGLLRREPGTALWQILSPQAGERIFLHLADGPDRLYAATQKSEILESADGGRSWTRLGAR